MRRGPRIYNLFPSMVGSTEDWAGQLGRIAEMAFDWVFVNPFHFPGFSGSLYAVKDYFRLNPLFRGQSEKTDDALLADFLRAADRHGLSVMMDLVVNHTAKDSRLVDGHPEWFARDAEGRPRSPGAVDPTDPAKFTEWGDLAEIDYTDRPERADIIGYWREVVDHYARLGFRGFRGDAAYKVPAAVWRSVIESARAVRPESVFFAETLGCRPEEVVALHDAGFDFIFNSSKWWDFRAPWLLEQYETFRKIAPSISFPESHDTERLAEELERNGIAEPGQQEAIYRQRYLFAAAFSTGVMMPIGYEFGFGRRLHVVQTRPGDWEEPRFDLSEFIADVNRMKGAVPALNQEGRQTRLSSGDSAVVGLLRRGDEPTWSVTLINTDQNGDHIVRVDDAIAAGAPDRGVEVTPGHDGTPWMPGKSLRLQPSEVRIFADGGGHRAEAKAISLETKEAGKVDADLTAGLSSKRIIIQDVYPEIDGGRYPAKREVGDLFDVWADIFKEGHDKLTAVLKYRRHDEAEWREVPMRLAEPGLDRWHGTVRLEQNARFLYTIEAWTDVFSSWLDEIEKKIGAGQPVGLELIEGREIVEGACDRASAAEAKKLRYILSSFEEAGSDEARAALLRMPELQRLMDRVPDRSQAVCYDRQLSVVADRVSARFAAWYEMFPRSQGTDPTRSATFADCIRRLDDVRAMGFDVVYLVPIHPIGRKHRKGRNNTLTAGDKDPGSPYAIGSVEGGHDAVHPELGTLDDFRAFVAAAEERGMEVALDFAIQCSPDHPWLEEHPGWFVYRPDGSIKYAENPPKKYQDIVNLNFDSEERDELWRALRDVVLFWVAQGVRTFRVDNPHTKPVPFWEWLIREVQGRHPEVIFLSEAFTRPKMLKMLAKAGFSQSYTYFTWRNFKGELMEYSTELAQSECAEYLRPNFFTNTPDILPPFLQTGGRPAFQIRLVLAATLASLYGIYNSFELCEATAVPGTEEYLDSEKYQYKVWDWNRPGNIKDYIAAVNRIRRENPALHHLRNLRFYPASDDNVLFYGKMTPRRDNVVLVAVNLDPFDAHEAEIRLPLAEIGIEDDAPYQVDELLTGARHLWRGAEQRVRLDPQRNPASILRLAAWEQVDFREPCY